MFFILPLAFVLLVVLYIKESERYIEAYLKAIAIWCGLLLFQIEVQSIFYMLNKTTVFIYWLLVSIVLLFLLCLKMRRNNEFRISNHIKNGWYIIRNNNFFAIVFIMILGLALVTVPYNWDSMTYHLARIVHWVQNQSVAHYATHCIRQISNPPLHEFICLDIYLLSGNRDFFLNLIQGFSFVTNAWLIYEIVIKLGCASRFCKIGVLMFISMPIAFGEALTTQNDNLAAVFFLAFVYFILDFWRFEKRIENNKATYGKCCTMGAMVGFGYLTKPTVSMGMLFLALVLLGVCIWRRDSVRTILGLCLAVIPILAILIVPEMVRNIVTFDAIFPSGTGARQLVGTLEPRYLLINSLKNLSFNLPSMYITDSNTLLVNIIENLAQMLGVVINNPNISEDARSFVLGSAGELGHDMAVNSNILLLSLFCFVWCIYRGKKVNKFQRMYTYITIGLFILFCTFIRWNPFVSRYMLPYLGMLCPLIAIWIEDICCNAKKEWLRLSIFPISCWLGVTGLIMLFSYHGKIAYNQDMGRAEGYFANRREIESDYMKAEEIIEKAEYRYIGLIMDGDSYEYPIQYMLKYDVDRIEHVMVNNETDKYEDITYKPDCILTTTDMGETIEVHEKKYERVMLGNYINIYQVCEK